MKTLKHYLLPLLIFFLFFGISSCENDDQQSEAKIEIGFSFSNKTLKSGNCDIAAVTKAVITVQKSDGEVTEYEAKHLDVYKMNNRVFTQKIALVAGDYKLTEFLLIDDAGNILFAIPFENSVLAERVTTPLPIDFTVSKDTSRDVPLEVVCVDNCSPEDFGLAWFEITGFDLCPCPYLVSITELGSNAPLNATVTVSSGDYIFEADVTVEKAIDALHFKCGFDEYTLIVKAEGYQTYEQVYTGEEIEKCQDEPLVIELMPAMPCSEEYTTDLIAGQNIRVGYIKVAPVDGLLTVTYKLTEPDWYLAETHLALVESLDEIVNGGDNPQPGQFKYKQEHEPGTISYTYQIENLDHKIYTILTHAAVVKAEANLLQLEEILPKEPINIQVQYVGDPTYFQTTITGAGNIDGTYPGNCVDLDHVINSGVDYDMNMVSSYSDDVSLLAELVDKPDNLDVLNYLINQDYSDMNVGGAEMQAAIWTIIDDIKPVNDGSVGITWNQEIVDAMVNDAFENGEGFTPSCGQKVLVLLDPGVADGERKAQVTLAQITVAHFEMVCTEETETAWGEGYEVLGSNWAMYFKYCY